MDDHWVGFLQLEGRICQEYALALASIFRLHNIIFVLLSLFLLQECEIHGHHESLGVEIVFLNSESVYLGEIPGDGVEGDGHFILAGEGGYFGEVVDPDKRGQIPNLLDGKRVVGPKERIELGAKLKTLLGGDFFDDWVFGPSVRMEIPYELMIFLLFFMETRM